MNYAICLDHIHPLNSYHESPLTSSISLLIVWSPFYILNLVLFSNLLGPVNAAFMYMEAVFWTWHGFSLHKIKHIKYSSTERGGVTTSSTEHLN